MFWVTEQVAPGESDMDNAELAILIEEVWDGIDNAFVTVVSLPGSDERYTIGQSVSGPFVGDYYIAGPGYYSDGWVTLDRAIACATDHALGE